MTLSAIINQLSSTLWNFLIPFLLVIVVFLTIKHFKHHKLLLPKEKIDYKSVFGQLSVGMGSMIGTGAVVGVLGAISKMGANGQYYFEAIVFWVFIGALVFIPIVFYEIVIAKFTKFTPKEYISKLISPKAGFVYAILFTTLYIFGFVGFQFSGLSSVFQVVINDYTSLGVSSMTTYFILTIPITIATIFIVLQKKHDLFIKVLGYAIFLGVIIYTLLLLLFVFSTFDYIPIFFERMWQGVTTPINVAIGLPIGLIIGWQRIVQISEPGLSSRGLVSLEENNGPRTSIVAVIIPILFTLVLAVFGTTYIISYSLNIGSLILPDSSVGMMSSYMEAINYELGMFGVIAASTFLVLAAFSTILGAYYFIDMQFDVTASTKNKYYFGSIILAGFISMIGFTIIFDVVDLLMFGIIAINLTAIAIFYKKLTKANKNDE